jgi:hypothetical protein
MRTLVIGLVSVPFAIALIAPACGGTSRNGFDTDGGGSSGSGGGSGSGGAGGAGGSFGSGGSGGSTGIGLGDSGGGDAPADGSVKTTILIYANTDTELYSLNPMMNTVTDIGPFAGTVGDASYDKTITDVAVDAEGDVYVISETELYKAALPKGVDGGVGTGTVNLTPIAPITTTTSTGYDDFYALAFAPKGFLGSGETLIGGDSNGELWSIDTTTGATQDLGNFGPVPGSTTGQIFALSGDMVFYTDSMSKPTGLATIRPCTTGKDATCVETNDYLAGIDMTALAAAYTGKTHTTSLLGGIYGGTSTTVGPGTTYGEIYGLGAWEGTVFGFTRAETGKTDPHPPQLLTIDTTSGKGTVVPVAVDFTTNGWSGAGVSTTTTITIKPPPPPPK